jgi:hypothetical protein
MGGLRFEAIWTKVSKALFHKQAGHGVACQLFKGGGKRTSAGGQPGHS